MGATASHGAATCYPASYPAAFPPHMSRYARVRHDYQYASSSGRLERIHHSASRCHWHCQYKGRAQSMAGTDACSTSTVAYSLGKQPNHWIAPSGSCNVGPNGHADTQSGFIPQDFQLPLTCHSNQNTGSAGWSISVGTAPTSQTLKNYHWHSHNTFAPGVTASPNRQWMASPCAMPVYKTAYCLAPDRVLLGGATGQIPGELAVPAAAVDGNLNAPVLAAGGR